jgi:pimeloyl-ACP methyl ester carboxylesterase
MSDSRTNRFRSVRLSKVVVREAIATVRSAAWPLARLHRLPRPGSGDGRRPVVLVHGYLGHPDMFRPLMRKLYEADFAEVARVSYPSTRLTLPQIVEYIDAVARPLAREFGEVDVVAHSLGAFSTRAWLREFGGDDIVRRFVSLGGPHAGTTFYRLTPPNLWPVLDPKGYWVNRLSGGPEPVDTVVVRARYDQQVFPPERASLPGVREVVLHGHGHNSLLWSRAAHRAVVDALLAPTTADGA